MLIASKSDKMKSKILFHDRKMVIPIETGCVTHYYGELIYILFDKPYCVLYFTGNIKYRVETSLRYMMDNLPELGFMKCKRSVIINICYYKSFRKIVPEVVMEDGASFKLSRQNVLDFKMMIKCLPNMSPPCPACHICADNDCGSRLAFCRRKKRHHNWSGME